MSNDSKKIFVALSSRDEPELVSTIKDCLEKATYPDRVIFGISTQTTHGEKPDLSFLDDRHRVIYLDSNVLYGVGHPRFLVSKLFSNEDYFFQLDAHSVFVPGWDVQIIDEFTELQEITGNSKVIISGYTGNEPYPVHPRPIWTWIRLEDIRHFHPTEKYFEDETELTTLTQFITAHYLFASKEFIKDFEYPTFFRYPGEEVYLGVEAFTLGYDIYAQKKYAAFHYDTRLRNKDRTIYEVDASGSSMYIEKDYIADEVFRLLTVNGGTLKDLKLDIRDRPRTIDQFMEFHGIDISYYYSEETPPESAGHSAGKL